MNFSQKAFGKDFDISQQTYASYELGKAICSTELMTKLAKKYNINLHWLITGYGSMYIANSCRYSNQYDSYLHKEVDNDNNNVPMTNLKVSAGGGKMLECGEFSGQILKIPRKIALRYPRNSNFEGALVEGDSMEPTLHDGDQVVFVRDFIHGDGVYVLAVDDALLVKRLEFDRILGVLHIISDNPRYLPKKISLNGQNNVRILGKVIIWVHGEI